MAREAFIDARIGETRAGLVQNGRLVELRVRRWADEAVRAHIGDAFIGRAGAFDRGSGGVFVHLSAGPDGFLSIRRDEAPPPEGAMLNVRVTREAVDGKGPGLVRVDDEAPAGPPRRVHAAGIADDWRCETFEADADQAAALDEAIEAALAPSAPIPGGGRLTIERTAACVAVDVDAANRPPGSDRARFMRGLNVAAAGEAARQIRLRGLAGLIIIDLAGHPRGSDAGAIVRAAQDGFGAGPGDPRVEFADISRFGVLELARERRALSLAETLLGPDGAPTPQTQALDGLARLVRLGGSARGRTPTLGLPAAAHAWLETGAIDWRGPLTRALGPRFAVEARTGAAVEAWLA
jgi:Ribonuclease G/E